MYLNKSNGQYIPFVLEIIARTCDDIQPILDKPGLQRIFFIDKETNT